MILLRLLELNELMPHYWSNLIMLAMQLLTPEEREELNQKIFDVEKLVLETEMVRRELSDGSSVWVERIKGRLSLYDIEMASESNPDFYSYFERPDGTQVSKFDVERQLNNIKGWLYEQVRDRSQGRRFTRFR